MGRQLRPRTSKPNYAINPFLDLDDSEHIKTEPLGDTVSPTTTVPAPYIDEGDSGSDFTPENEEDTVEQMERYVEDEETFVDDTVEDVEDDDYEGEDEPMNLIKEEDAVKIIQSVTKGKGKAKSTGNTTATKKNTTSSAALGMGIARRRQMYTLPIPSVHHRHRAVPLYSREGLVERLAEPPKVFKAPTFTMTNAFTAGKVTNRVNKAWGYNVGAGPLWELVEDRGWFKEAEIAGTKDADAMDVDENVNAEGVRRPIVHRNVVVKNGWQILSKEYAAVYLPTDDVTTEEGNFKSPPPIPCSIGPFKSQTRIEMSMFESLPLSRFMPESRSHIFNPGAPAWGIDWCPIHQSERSARGFKQYLAVAPFPSVSHSPEVGVKAHRPSTACIQIWSLSPSINPIDDSQHDSGMMKCEMVICIDDGPAHELKWCPLPSHDEFNSEKRPKKLGILAGTFEDGSLSIYAIPDPEDLKAPANEIVTHDPNYPICVKLSAPLIRIELEETSCWSIDWANSELLAVGTTNGVVAIYNLGSALRSSTSPDAPTITDLLPTQYITVHQSAVRALSWIKAPPTTSSGIPKSDEDPTVVVSGAYDGTECMTDIREGHGCVMNRTRDVVTTITYSPYNGGPITIDHENIVKAYSASPSMLGRGHTLMDPLGPVWSLSASEWHPQLAVGSADGSLSTTNMLRTTRRGGSVPFFQHKIFQMDYSRKTGEYRMLDRFLPQETQDRPNNTRKANAASSTSNSTSTTTRTGTGSWPTQIAIHKTTWNNGNGPNSSGLLASAMSCGFCRVDNVWGRWLRDKMPYGSIEVLRREGAYGNVDGEGEGEGDGESASSEDEA